MHNHSFHLSGSSSSSLPEEEEVSGRRGRGTRTRLEIRPEGGTKFLDEVKTMRITHNQEKGLTVVTRPGPQVFMSSPGK